MPEAKPQNQANIEKANSKSRRGFASMNKDRHKLVSSQGGKSSRVKSEERIERQHSTHE